MQIIEVKTGKSINEFHRLPFKIYKGDRHWIPHLRQDIENVFTPGKNKFFRHGKAIRWILKDGQGKTIGRIAAFVNEKTARSFKQPTGGVGFFECINDREASQLLFDTAKQWLLNEGMEAMDGPINFGEKDRYWGVITENFDAPPYYMQNYNPPYYVELFEAYGFREYYQQFIFSRKVAPIQDTLKDKSQRIFQDPKFEPRTINKKNWEQYAEDFRTIYNRAWVSHDNFKGMPAAQAKAIVSKMLPIMDEDLIIFMYYDNRPVGFYIALPEINEVFKRVNGNFNWWGKVKFFIYFKLLKKYSTAFGIAFGVDPDFQGRGLEGAIFQATEDRIVPKGKYKNVIITWIGDFNPKMIKIINELGAKKFRTMATYRKLFDENAPFERAPIIGH